MKNVNLICRKGVPLQKTFEKADVSSMLLLLVRDFVKKPLYTDTTAAGGGILVGLLLLLHCIAIADNI